MHSYTVRNIPEEVYTSLQQAARDHGRSFNAEVLSILSDEAKLAFRRLEMRRDLGRFKQFRDRVAQKQRTRFDSVDLIREDRDTR
jgi:plasmid stability protein